MAANETKLGQLHDLVADALIQKVKGSVILDEDGQEVGKMEPTAADLQAAAKFLKDNQITCAPSDDNRMGELDKALAERNARRVNRRASRQELDGATQDASFLKGLN